MTQLWGMSILPLELVSLNIFFQISLCISTGNNVKCPDQLEMPLLEFQHRRSDNLIESNNEHGTIDISNGLKISCISKFPSAFHFEGNSTTHLLNSESEYDNHCFTYTTTVTIKPNFTTGNCVCSTIAAQGIKRAVLFLNTTTSGILFWKVIKNDSAISRQVNSLVLHCPARKPTSTLNVCEETYISRGLHTEGESLSYAISPHEEFVNGSVILNSSGNGDAKINLSCISYDYDSGSSNEITDEQCIDYEDCSCTDDKDMLLHVVDQRICVMDIPLECKNLSVCEFTPINTINSKPTEVSKCKKAIDFTDNFPLVYNGQIIDVECKATNFLFSRNLKLFHILKNNTIVEIGNSTIELLNNDYILKTELTILSQTKGLRCAAPYLHSAGWQSQDTSVDSFKIIKNPIPPRFLNPVNETKYVAGDGKDTFNCKAQADPRAFTIGLYYTNGTRHPIYADFFSSGRTPRTLTATFSNVNIRNNTHALVCRAFYPDLKGFSEATHTITLCFVENCDKPTTATPAPPQEQSSHTPQNVTEQQDDEIDDPPLKIERNESSSDLSVYVVAGSSVIIITITVVVILVLWTKCMQTKNPKFEISCQMIKDFLKGNSAIDSHFYKTPYRSEDEVLEPAIKIECLLGSGHFGVVNKGILTTRNKVGEEEKIIVAIKSAPIMVSARGLRSNEEREEAEKKFLLFLKEVKILQEIKHHGGHENVVKYIGAMTKNIKHFNVNAILEYCEGGDLKTYLTRNKPYPPFKNKFLDAPEILPSTPSVGYSTISFAAGKCKTPDKDPQSKFDTDDLIRWAREIASGMEYLSALKVIHFDLAARNVLLAKVEGKLVAKVNDFGLSKKLNRESKPYYQVLENSVVAIHWQPPDLKVDGTIKLTLNSDIWSYGVTLWEIFTLGKDPDVNLGKESKVEKPQYANCAVYNIMLKCFHLIAEDRPKFAELKTEFTSLEKELQLNSDAYVDAFTDEDSGFGSFMN